MRLEEEMSEPENKKLFVRFRDHEPTKLPNGKMSKPPKRVEFGNGEFRRTFDAGDQPFAVTAEEALALKNSGLFVDAEPPPPATNAAEEVSGPARKLKKTDTDQTEAAL
jgi:hypothetical protein